MTDTSACSGNEFAGNNADDDNEDVPPGGGDDYDLDNAERCKKEGYNKTSCQPGEVPSNYCIYDSTYFEDCTCPSGYTTCEAPYYGAGTACGNKYASCEKDTERACQELNPGYVDECGKGQQLSDDRCSYDNTYGTCCNTCAGYDYTYVPEGYVQDGEACTGCDGQEHYKIKPNPCDGFMDCGSMGPDTGANSCLSGTTTKYDNCKPCPNLGTLTSCPSPYTCTYEDCSGLWYKSGCQSGYDWNANSQTCTAQCAYKGTLTSCPSPFTCTYEACTGKYYKSGCQSGYDWDGVNCTYDSSCDCPDGYSYYKTKCSTINVCGRICYREEIIYSSDRHYFYKDRNRYSCWYYKGVDQYYMDVEYDIYTHYMQDDRLEFKGTGTQSATPYSFDTMEECENSIDKYAKESVVMGNINQVMTCPD